MSPPSCLQRSKFNKPTFLLLRALVLSAAMVALSASSCRPQYSRTDPVLQKPMDQLTDQDLGRMVAVVKTNYGTFRFQLHPDWAPKTCRSFVKLVKTSFYNGLTFHEVRANDWIVGGDPLGTGEGGPGYSQPLELSKGHNLRGAVGLYYPFRPLPRLEVAGSQFYVLLSDQKGLDDKYTVFGQVIEGMSTVDRIGSVPATPRGAKPRPYAPFSTVTIQDLHLEVKK